MAASTEFKEESGGIGLPVNTGPAIRSRYALGVLLFSLLLAGCTSFGPKMMKGERTEYNLALQETNDKQLLLKLVRMRYRDNPAFLEVGSITSQTRLDLLSQASAELQRSVTEGNTDVFSIAGRALHFSQPTHIYTPLQGEAFFQRVLSPISLDRLMLLYRSGWSMRRVFFLCVHRLNGVRSGPRIITQRSSESDEYNEFTRVLDLLHELDVNLLVVWKTVSDDLPSLETGIRRILADTD